MKKLFISLALLAGTSALADTLPLNLWYHRPAMAFEESLPIGNGKLGALIYGGADNDSIYLNDITLWTGKPVDPEEGGLKYQWIPKIREALFREDYKAADSLQHYVQGHNSEFYQPLAILNIKDNNKGAVTDYHRQLNLDNALATVSYRRGGVEYSKEYFASNPDRMVAIRIAASQKGAVNTVISLSSLVPHKVKASDGQLTMTGHAIGDETESIHFCSILSVKYTDGKVTPLDSTLILEGVSEAVIYFVNETSFNGFDKHPVKQGAAYIEKVTDDQWHLQNFTYEQLRQRHIADYASIFSRVSFSLDGACCDTVRDTEQQLLDYTDKQEKNPYLEMLYFQYGRYLLIGSSRTEGVPANLQGLWAPAKFSPWRGNYTVNINLEENYWPAECANLSDLVYPVDGFVKALSTTGRYTAQHFYGVNEGWCAGHNSDIWAMSNPVGTGKESPKWSNWAMGGAWLVETLWDHYDFTRDKEYLRNTAYPLMKGASDFLLNWLVENPHKPGEFITAPSTSPEAEFVTDSGYKGCTLYGGTADLAIIRELLTNTLKGARSLGVDEAYQKRLENTISRLRPYQIGHRGNLQEWYHDWADEDWHHRHQSHLLGLYPFWQITPSSTPDLAQASTKTLEIKGDKTTGWSTGWRINLWARLHRGDQAYHIFRKLLTYVTPDAYKSTHHRSGGTYPNLFDAHPPFQIDGNFGGTAGVCEMLMQCDGENMTLLPALPDPWKEGEVAGLKARGNYEVAISWKDNKVRKATVKSIKGGEIKVAFNGKTKMLKLKAGQAKVLK